MSYILDALRRSEEERNRGHIPTLKTVYYDESDHNFDFLHTTVGRVLVVALLLAVAALLYSNRQPVVGAFNRIFGLQDNQAVVNDAQITGNQQAASASTGETVAAAPESQLEQAFAESGGVRDTAVAPRAESQPVQPVPDTQQPSTADSSNLDREDTSQIATAQPQSTLQPPQQQVVTAAPVQTQPVQSQPVQTQSIQPEQAANQPQSPKNASGGVKTRHDLPPDLKRSLPKLSLSVVSYAADPQKRFVMVGAEMFYEGDEVTDDMVIESITSDGPVVSWRGHEFLLKP